ncbi:MAG: RagB/SusD family nutrient uptake outer membrane protein [Mediterranea sp.]|jgi:hypothetical protein|nr:RagB/SusD family nutrient uptake outer membrane protein [Mediterranea sp.]
MKKLYKYAGTAILGLSMTSCLGFLDIVPDEIPTSADAFMDEAAIDRFLYSCYAYMPMPAYGSESIDLMTGDEVITAFEHEKFSQFPKGNYTAASPGISYWDTFFQGLRQCYLLINNVGTVTYLSQDKIDAYKTEAEFLIAYYHYLLVRCYGSTILIKEEPDATSSVENYLGRSPLDECVDFVCETFDKAAAGLPTTRTGKDYGRATSIAAKALKAKMLVYAASPLLNSDRYKDVVDSEGNHLFPLTADPSKWTKAKTALEEAITLAKGAGHELYTNTTYGDNTYPKDPVQRSLRFNLLEPGNPDIIWADCRDDGGIKYYGIQNKSLPGGVAAKDPLWNGVSPTWAMLSRFYTENGLPIDEDPEYNFAGRLSTATITDDKNGAVNGKTLYFNLHREPRYYAWIAYESGWFEITDNTSNGTYTSEPTYKDGRLVTGFIIGENSSRGPSLNNMRTSNYAPTCFLNKKGVHPDYKVQTGTQAAPAYPWPLMRMADLYLLYAEACVECNDLSKAKEYLNKIREHAGIPTVETAWQGIADLNQAKLRDIVRRERMIECYLENQNFWDVRRWLMGDECFNRKVQGLKNDATTLETMSQVVTYDFERKFAAHQYLLPIPDSDVRKNPKIKQNPGY